MSEKLGDVDKKHKKCPEKRNDLAILWPVTFVLYGIEVYCVWMASWAIMVKIGVTVGALFATPFFAAVTIVFISHLLDFNVAAIFLLMLLGLFALIWLWPLSFLAIWIKIAATVAAFPVALILGELFIHIFK